MSSGPSNDICGKSVRESPLLVASNQVSKVSIKKTSYNAFHNEGMTLTESLAVPGVPHAEIRRAAGESTHGVAHAPACVILRFFAMCRIVL